MSVRRRLIKAEAKTKNGAIGSLRRRNSKTKAAPEVIPFDSHEVLSGVLKGPVYSEFRDGDYIHVSDLIHKCSRKIALSKRLREPIDPEPLFDSNSLTYCQGHAIAEFIVKKIAHKAPRNAYGVWTCPCASEEIEGTKHAVKDIVCDTCGHPLDIYKEIVIKDDELRLTGSIDLIFREDGAFVIVELKSIAKSYWEKLERPVPEHLIQVLIYWYLMQKAGKPLHDKIVILYAVKEMIFARPYKEFVVQPSKHLFRLDDYLEDAQTLKSALHDNGDLPPRLTCPSQDSPAAKKCQFRETCFQL